MLGENAFSPQTIQEECLALSRPTPLIWRSAREQGIVEMRKLEQVKLSIERYIEKYQSWEDRSPVVDQGLLYNWFIAGLSSRERQSVTGCAMRGECCQEVGVADMMEYLRRKERKNATSSALAEKEESGSGDVPRSAFFLFG
ncbi:uncharacterized protein EMH_0020970 [Eimeria mitis]|uniref:Uncharacterized protein n=1 Tax=Eimeria mitis TaxID=44415 RepID=U6KCP2_9EIME|nr:uncharacterized protein EMH_0020970 [Eimeria mitis]CDJ34556.1 hypothetical protein EMH_0020970 [Eimeria mitis]